MVLCKWEALSFTLFLANLPLSLEFMVFLVVGAFLNFLPAVFYSTSVICSKFKFPASSVLLFVVFWNLGIYFTELMFFKFHRLISI